MKHFNTYLIEKLKVSTNSKIDPRDDNTVGKLYGNDEDKENFQKYLHDCLKRDKYDIQTYNINFIHDRVMFYFSQDQISIILCPFSNDDTYIELYNRIIDNLKEKQFITEKLKVSKDNIKEYTFKTNKINTNNTYKFDNYYLGNTTMDLFEDYWYCMLENEDQAFVENNNIHYDDIYLDYDCENVYINDNNTGDEILISERGSAYSFQGAYDTILEYFEDKNL